MEMSSPYAIYSKSDPQTAETNKDYSMTAPLDKGGSDWPAKGRATKEIVDATDVVATLVAGEDFSWDLAGTATHNGGSCQVGVSYDYMETQVVIASWIGDCPLKKPYTFKVPDIPGCDKCVFFWSWFNKTGNREMYQNAAVVSISGTATSFTGPQAYRMNTFGEGVCSIIEEVVAVFPNPGDQVFFGEGFDASTASVTVTGSGGPTNAKPSGGAAGGSSGSSGSSSTSSAAGSAETGASSAGGEEATTAATGGATGGAGAGTGTGTGTGAGAAATKASSAAGAAGTTGSTGGSTGSGSNSGTGSSSSSTGSNDKEFLFFAGGAILLVLLGGLVIFFAHKKATSGSSGGGGYRPSSRDSSDSSSSDGGYAHRHKRRGGRRRSRRRRYRDEEKNASSSNSDD
ncbi:hypothetical protein JCM10449v2_001045 [Rhodotorula kratochvilovae]